MKRIFLAAILLSFFSFHAAAADLPPVDEPPVLAPEDDRWSWTGFYAGGQVGYGEADWDGIFDSSDLATPAEVNFLDDLNLDGIVGGVHLGYNWQVGRIVLGVEGDVTLTDWQDETADAGGNDLTEGDIDLLATIRGRAGAAFGRTLAYVTAGPAFKIAEYTITDDTTPGPVSIDLDDIGVAAGGGAEFRVTERFSLRAEGLFYWFDDEQDTSTLTADSDAGDFVRFENAWIVRAGGSFHF